MNKPIRCAVIGQNPMRFPWGFDEEDKFCSKMKTELAQQIMVLRQRGVSQFLTACDCGVGLYAGEIINGLRTTDRDLMLICYIPHEEQATKWALPAGTLLYYAGEMHPYLRCVRGRCAGRAAPSLQEDHRPCRCGADGL